MNLKSFRAAHPLYRLALAALLALPVAAACSDEDVAPPLPLAFGLEITSLDPSGDQPLKCNEGLAVHVAISSENALEFTLRPSRACGSSNHCGYVRFEALDAGGEVLEKVDSVTTVGLLLDQNDARLADVAEVRASLIRGADDEPLINADGEAVQATVEVVSKAAANCVPAMGSGGAGGQSGLGGAGSESGGAPSAGAPSAGAPSTGGVPSSSGGAGGSPGESGGAGGAQ